jgi:hypothetical protein
LNTCAIRGLPTSQPAFVNFPRNSFDKVLIEEISATR